MSMKKQEENDECMVCQFKSYNHKSMQFLIQQTIQFYNLKKSKKTSSKHLLPILYFIGLLTLKVLLYDYLSRNLILSVPLIQYYGQELRLRNTQIQLADYNGSMGWSLSTRNLEMMSTDGYPREQHYLMCTSRLN